MLGQPSVTRCEVSEGKLDAIQHAMDEKYVHLADKMADVVMILNGLGPEDMERDL